MKKTIMFFVFLSVIGLYWVNSSYAEDKSEVKIGISTALSGDYEVMGKTYLEGWEAYFKKANKEENGINGKKLVWKVLDDSAIGEKALENTKQLLNWGADVLAGYLSTSCVRNVIDYLETNKIEKLFFFPMDGGKFIKQDIKAQLYSIDPTYRDEAELLLYYFVTERNAYNWGIVYEDSYVGRITKNTLEEKLSEYALRPILVDINNDMAVRQLIEFWPDVIVLALDTKEAYAFIEKLVENIDPKKMPSVIAISSVFPCVYIKKISNIMPSGKFFFTQITPHPKDMSYPIISEYLNALKKYEPQAKPCFVSLKGYIAAKLMCEILRKAGDTSVYSASGIAEGVNFDLGVGKKIRFTPVIHRVPIGVGLFCVEDKGPKIKTLLWEDFTYRKCGAGHVVDAKKKQKEISSTSSQIASEDNEEKKVKEKLAVDVKIDEVIPVN